MSVLIIDGTLQEIEGKLERIRDVLKDKAATGYPLFNHAENWRYSSSGDSRVCPICSQYDGQIFSGDAVKSTFPSVEYLGSYEAHPRTHDNPGFPSYIQRRIGAPHGCGCKLTLLNPAEAFEAQLHKDKAAML